MHIRSVVIVPLLEMSVSYIVTHEQSVGPVAIVIGVRHCQQRRHICIGCSLRAVISGEHSHDNSVAVILLLLRWTKESEKLLVARWCICCHVAVAGTGVCMQQNALAYLLCGVQRPAQIPRVPQCTPATAVFVRI